MKIKIHSVVIDEKQIKVDVIDAPKHDVMNTALIINVDQGQKVRLLHLRLSIVTLSELERLLLKLLKSQLQLLL